MDSEVTPSTPFSFKRLISLKPHGNNLLTPGAAGWFFIARVLVIMMASAEAISWGYIGSLFFIGKYSYISAFITGGFVFLIIWGADATLMTLDRARPFYEYSLYDKPIETNIKARSKEAMAIFSRLFIVTVSLIITAPFLAQIIFGRDIRKELETETTAIIKDARDGIEKKYAAIIDPLTKSIDKDRILYTEEVAGRPGGVSRRFGDGPVARTIASRIEANESTLKQQKTAMKAELDSFDKSVKDKNFSELRNRWGVVLQENSIIKVGELLTKVEESPTYKKTELAIKAFLSFLFLSLLILKIFEPRSVKVYLSEALQQEWQRYDAGAFDSWLASEEKSKADPRSMTPYRFEDIMLNVYPIIRKEDMARRQNSVVDRQAKEDTETLVVLRDEIEADVKAELEKVTHETTAIDKEIDRLTKEAEFLPVKHAQLFSEISRLESKLEEFNSLLGNSGDQPRDIEPKMVPVVQRMVNTVSQIEAELHEKRTEFNQLDQKKVALDKLLAPLYAKRNNLEEQKAKLEAKSQLVDAEIDAIRSHRIAEIRSHRVTSINEKAKEKVA